eukprot:4231293-Amphidinium_carterae.1
MSFHNEHLLVCLTSFLWGPHGRLRPLRAEFSIVASFLRPCADAQNTDVGSLGRALISDEQEPRHWVAVALVQDLRCALTWTK